MISPSISNSKLHSSGNAAHALPTAISANASTLDLLPAEPFASLLARQISESNLSIQDAAQIAIPIDGNAADGNASLPLKDSQEKTAIADSPPSDPVNMLAAILQQLPVPEDRGQKVDSKQPLALIPRKTDDYEPMQPITPSPFQKIDRQQATPPFVFESAPRAEQKKPLADTESRQSLQIPARDLPKETIKRAESVSDLPQPTHTASLIPAKSGVESASDLSQPTPPTTQAISSTPISAAMPGLLTSSMQEAGTLSAITTPLGGNGWAEEFSQKISWISTQQNQVAELHLNPPNLGPLDVVLKISNDQVTVAFTSPHGAVRDAVENALPKLREVLADNGIMLGNATVSDQPPRERDANAFMNQGSNSAAQHEISGSGSASVELQQAAAQSVPVRRHNGMVDTFV